jgi:hypothetical protein
MKYEKEFKEYYEKLIEGISDKEKILFDMVDIRDRYYEFAASIEESNIDDSADNHLKEEDYNTGNEWK